MRLSWAAIQYLWVDRPVSRATRTELPSREESGDYLFLRSDNADPEGARLPLSSVPSGDTPFEVCLLRAGI